MSSLKNKTIVITGASRGIGREIALKCARDGANLVLAAKSAEPHPKLPGTIYSVAEEVEAAGGQALPYQLDVREDEAVLAMAKAVAEHFGSIDGLINNAGAIKLLGAEMLPLKRFDLMHQINTRAVLSCSKAVLPWLKQSESGHIINLSPPLNLDPKWFAQYGPYTITKYGMSMLTTSLAQELKRQRISVTSLWPKTVIATAAIEHEAGSSAMMKQARIPAIMADAAYEILTTTDLSLSGQHLIDEDLLRARGVTDFDAYKNDPDCDKPLLPDLFL